MEKQTLIFKEYPDHVKDYALIFPPVEAEYWEFIFQNIPPNKKYLKHFVRTEFIVNENLPNYKPKGFTDFDNESLSISRGTLRYYIDLYTDEK